MIQFIFGLAIGAGVVGSSVMRTLAVEHKNQRLALISSIVNGVSYFLSVKFIAEDNIIAFLGTVIGSTITVCYMARKK